MGPLAIGSASIRVLFAKRHVDALGGLQRIVDTVKPALVRDLGEAVYLQLTSSVATATGPESLAQQRALTAQATPLLPVSIARPDREAGSRDG